MTNDHEPPNDRFCDLVMKGGTTSGVVYPRAIAELSHHYRFRSIGGTSAGAIAAAVTAAAEYQRRRTGSRKGFDELNNIPNELADEVAPGTRKLLTLFQPQPSMRRLFSVLVWGLNRETTSLRIGWTIIGFLRVYWLATLGAVGLAGLFGAVFVWHFAVIGLSCIAASLIFVIALPALVGTQVFADITRRLVDNNFGLCTGMTVDATAEHSEERSRETARDGLTPWLHNLIQTAAGRSIESDPLTFGDLWDAPGLPSWLNASTNPKPRSIDLQMFTTNLSHGRPYILPLSEGSSQQTRFRDRERLFFKEKEILKVLPGNVVKWMTNNSKPYSVDPGREGKDPDVNDPSTQDLRALPHPKDFPILLAARMSLSFPFLFSAIPLYAIDYDLPSTDRKVRCCWFSDGGISSNFPIHLFDGLVPMWPTFGITLESRIKGRRSVFLPDEYRFGYGERWNQIPDKEENAPLSRLGKFIWAIICTMQNWNDNSLARMPGVRDRVARIRLDEHEGGLNLNMEKDFIDRIAALGVKAANELVERFALKGSEGWDEHRFVRLHVLLKMFEARSPGVLTALATDGGGTADFASLLDKMMNAKDQSGNSIPPAGYEKPMTKEEREAIDDFIIALQNLAMKTEPQSVSFKPIPRPELRVRPPL
ncbi:MAG: patatin-like phospholipase family protein [Nitrospira sp.]